MSSDPLGLDITAPTDDVAICVRDVSKHYVMFKRPEDRFKQMVVPRLQRLVGRAPKRYFTDFAALSGISFDVRRGETVGIIGRNGSGKSTLLQIVCGTLRPTAGSVEVNGRIAALLELGAGFNPEFTGRENVFLNAAILGVPRREMEWRFDDIARFADIGPFIDQPVKTYSSGMYVRLAFATAINVDPDILVVDEALSVGDEAFQRKCFARIEQIKNKGGTILFVSHAGQTIVQLCSRAILLDRGELLLEGEPKTVVNQYQRLIHAPSDTAQTIRDEIRSFGTTTSEDQPVAQQAAAAPRELHDPSLVAIGTVTYPENGARISDMRITSEHGQTVNILTANETYYLRYRTAFYKSSGNVGFAMLIKTVQGLELAGQTSHTPLKGQSVKAGEEYEVTFPFRTGLLPGTYFVNAGVYDREAAGDEFQMHRLVDFLAFRILPNNVGRQLLGLVDLVPSDDAGFLVERLETHHV